MASEWIVEIAPLMPCGYTVGEQMFLDDVVRLTDCYCAGPEGNLRYISGGKGGSEGGGYRGRRNSEKERREKKRRGVKRRRREEKEESGGGERRKRRRRGEEVRDMTIL